MSREMRLWTVLFVLGGLALLAKGTLTESGLGRLYVKPARTAEQGEVIAWTAAEPMETDARLSPARTVGLWIAAFLTLGIFSYLYRDNVLYKLAESIIVGVSAGYYFVAGFWDSIVAQLLVELAPDFTRAHFRPGFDLTRHDTDWWFVVPLVLSVFLFCKFVPGVGWLARWPLAFVVGTFAGLRLVLFLDADFVSQIRNTIMPLVVYSADGSFLVWSSLRNLGIILSVLACLTYFFFSVEHKGAIGRVSRIGIWVLMITFGASFAFTVMGRITLLTKRFEFLFVDWLRLIGG
ncbi:MAG: hypothetical protein SH850_27830 [Planctomycetaceae bacterium]|nr:hypothetical protein [Planctomycetaceae bacterium]